MKKIPALAYVYLIIVSISLPGFLLAETSSDKPLAKTAIFAMPQAKKAELVGMSTEKLGRIDEILQRHIDRQVITGAVIAVARDGKIVKYEALGVADMASNSSMRKDHLFQLYSSTKVITAVAVLMMCEEGKLRLSDPVSRYIPEFQNAKVAEHKNPESRYQRRDLDALAPPHNLIAANRDITILDLMTHTAGLLTSDPRRVGMNTPAREENESLTSYARKLGPIALDFQPGSHWSYSPAAGSNVLAALVEISSGMNFDDFLHKRIFAPLGMRDTYFNLPPEKRERLLPVYRKDGEDWVLTPHPIGQNMLQGRNPPQGSMGLASTAHDYLLLHQMLLDKGANLTGKHILGSRTVELMGTNHVGDLYQGEGAYPTFALPLRGHGFGMQVQVTLDNTVGDTGRSIGAFGWAGYLGTHGWTDPKERIAAVIMLQQNQREVHIDFERAIRQAIID